MISNWEPLIDCWICFEKWRGVKTSFLPATISVGSDICEIMSFTLKFKQAVIALATAAGEFVLPPASTIY